MYRKVKRLEDGEEHDLDAVIEAVTDLRTGHTPERKAVLAAEQDGTERRGRVSPRHERIHGRSDRRNEARI